MLEFKPLKQKRGSILLIVVSMMSVLIMLAQALLLSVSVTQQTQVTNFYDKQAYQTSLSISDLIASDIMNSSAGSLQSAVTALGLNETISTGANGFSAFDSAETREQLNKIGAYRVDITLINDNYTSGSETYKVYKIKTLTNYNGIEETVSTNLYLKETSLTFPGFDRFFTATGYGASDVFINKSTIMNPAYFDNQYTVIPKNNDDTAANIVYSNIIAGGSFQIENGKFFGETPYTRDLIVRNDFIIDGFQEFKIIGGQIFVGGDFITKQSLKLYGGSVKTAYNEDRKASVFVLGDFNIGGALQMNNMGDIYVRGNLSYNSLDYNASDVGAIYVNGNVYCNGTESARGMIYYSGDYYFNGGKKEPPTGNNDAKFVKVTDAWLQSSTNNAGNREQYAYIPCTTDNVVGYYESNGAKVAISTTTVAAYISDITAESMYPNYSPSEGFPSSKQQVGGNNGIVFDKDNYTCYINASDFNSEAIIRDVEIKSQYEGNSGGLNPTDIIPTILIENNEVETDENGDDVPKPFVIRLEANSNDNFYWSGEADKPVNVIIIGSSPVFFEIAEGAHYMANPYDFVGHYAWYSILQYTDSKNTFKKIKYDDKSTWISSKISNTLQAKQPTDTVTVKINELLFKTSDALDDVTGETVANSLNPEVVKSKLSGYYTDLLDGMHNNIFMFSVDKNADINMQADNCFFSGFIYAPYMTFKTLGGEGAGLAIAGGLIVSDYVLDDSRGYIFAAPTFDIANIVGENALESIVSRDWKRSIY